MASLNIQAIRDSIEANQKQWLIGSVAALVVIAGVLFVVLRPSKDRTAAGGGFEEGPAAAQPFGQPEPFGAGGGPPVGPPPMPGMGGPPMPGGGPPVGPPMPGGGPPMAGAPTDPFAAEAGAAVAEKPEEKKKGEPSLYAGVADPFAPIGAPKVDMRRLQAALRRLERAAEEQRQKQQLAALPWLSIYRAGAPASMPGEMPGQPQEPLIQVNRRTSGLLYGDRALAVLETDGQSAIVQPGDVLVSGGERVQVQRIDRDGMVLRRLDSKQPPIVVPLEGSRDVVAGSVVAPIPGGYPMPGGGPPVGPPMPGMMPGGGPPIGPPLPPL